MKAPLSYGSWNVPAVSSTVFLKRLGLKYQLSYIPAIATPEDRVKARLPWWPHLPRGATTTSSFRREEEKETKRAPIEGRKTWTVDGVWKRNDDDDIRKKKFASLKN